MPTRLRVLIGGCGVWLGIMLLAVIAYGYRYEISKLGDRFSAILIPAHGYFRARHPEAWIDSAHP
jgi:hypothetical protein